MLTGRLQAALLAAMQELPDANSLVGWFYLCPEKLDVHCMDYAIQCAFENIVFVL